MEFRSKAEIQGQIRVIVFPGVDACACCAPHVARTGEIGVFKVIAAQNWKGGTRIHMLAGDRAFAYIAKEHEMLHSTARFLSTSAENVESRVRAMREETQKLSLDLSIAREQLVLQDVARKSLAEENVCVFTEGLTPASQRRIVNALMETHSGYCGVFEGNESGYRYVIGGPQIASLEKLLEMKLGAKGGGREPMMQGSLTAAEEEIRAVFEGVQKA